VNASSETIKLGREGLTRVEFAGPLGFGGSHLDGDLVVPHINKSGLT
jgi:hypothetical protein